MANSQGVGNRKIPSEVEGNVLNAVIIVDDPLKIYLDSGVKLLILLLISVAIFAIWLYFMDFPEFRSPFSILRRSLETLGTGVLFVFGLLSIFMLPPWFKYRRLMKEGVLTQGIITQYVEIPESENNWPIPHIVYQFAEGAATLQKVGGRYRVGLPITVRYVPANPRLSRAELPE